MNHVITMGALKTFKTTRMKDDVAQLVNQSLVVQNDVSVYIHMSESVQSFFPHR